MATKGDLNRLILSGVKLTSCVLGQGSYGTVYKAEYNGTECAAKQADLNVESGLEERKKRNFQLECLQHSKLRHPNIVKMLGVFYPEQGINMPVLVMELMEYNLTQLLERSPNIIMYVKLSILQDVSRGLCYLHTRKPPVVHQALYSDNILLTKGLIAKVGDFKTGANTVSDQAVLSVRRNSNSNDFLPSSLHIVKYEPSLNVFSFGCLVCHVITQTWPSTQMHQPLVQETKKRRSQKRPVSTTAPPTYVRYSPAVGRKQSYTIDDWSVKIYQDYIDLISDNSLKHLVEACLQYKSKNRPDMSLIDDRMTSILTDHFNDNNIKKIYSLAMKEGLDQSKNFQLFLVGAENTGKTSLISSFLGEEFMERRSSTKGADVEVCKVYCKDWVRISHYDKSIILNSQFTDQCKGKVLNTMVGSSPSLKRYSFKGLCRESSITYADVLFTSVPLTQSMIAPPTGGASEVSSKPHQQYMLEACLTAGSDSLIASLWDFAGQTIFHNSHSVFISDGGVTVITFNAFMNLTDNIIPREGSSQPPECCTIISSIHYWLQVVNSVCSVEENVLLVGTHIDKLHPDIKEARNIASEKILPVLEMELCGKSYAKHIAGIGEGLPFALKQSCFFVSNKDRDEEIVCLQAATVEVAASLRKQKPIFFLKIERALLQLNKQVIPVSTLLNLVAENCFSLDRNSPEFKEVLQYFHNTRTILHFGQIESLKDLVILSPNWLAKLFSYIIAAQSYKTGGELDWAWKRLTKYGILHECLLQHMLEKFHSDYPIASSVQVTMEQVVDILLCFRLLARITCKAWFAEEGFPPLPESGDTFIVPSLVCTVDDRNPPKTEEKRIVYFMFNSGFIPTSLLNQLIAECICRSVRRGDRLLWMRRGKIGSQLGADQKYYISRCEEKQSIQLTITLVGDDEEHVEERKCLINNVTKLLGDIMKMFMPATKERPTLLIPCLFCPVLHILLDDACSGKAIFCPNANDKSLPHGYYGDLLQGHSTDAITIAGVDRKLEVFTAYYYKLSCLDFESLCPLLITARIISHEDGHVIQHTTEPSKIASCVLEKISGSLRGGTDVKFDEFLSVLQTCGNSFCVTLANQIRRDLLKKANALALTSADMSQPSCQDDENRYTEFTENHQQPFSQQSSPQQSLPQQSPPQQSPPQQSLPQQSPPQQSPLQQSFPQQSPPQQSPLQQSPPQQSPPQQSPPQQSPPQQSPPQQSPPQQSPPQQSPPQQPTFSQGVGCRCCSLM